MFVRTGWKEIGRGFLYSRKVFDIHVTSGLVVIADEITNIRRMETPVTNPPRRKTTLRPIFWSTESLSFQMEGIGAAMSAKSVTMFGIAVP